MKLFLLLSVLACGLVHGKSVEKRGLTGGDVIIEKIPYEAEILQSVIGEIKNVFEQVRDTLHGYITEEKLKKAHEFASAVVAQGKEKAGEAYDKALDLKQKLEAVLARGFDKTKTEVEENFDDEIKALGEAYDKLEAALKRGTEKVKTTVVGIKGWIWDVVDKYLEPYTDKKKRDLKSYGQLQGKEKEQWRAVIKELKTALREKYGIQDPEEDYRVDPEVRERFKQVKKELLKVMEEKNGPVNGYEDLTDDDWKEKWQKVVDELKQRFSGTQKRELKAYGQLTSEEKAKWKPIIAELKKVLKAKYGVQDPEEGYRVDPEVREKFKAVKKELLAKFGHTGHEDLTDAEWKKNWGKVVDELKTVLEKKQSKRELKSWEQMSPKERAQQDALLKELRQKLKEKFGVQDPEEGKRPSPETRHKLKELLKQIKKDQGHEDLTDAEWKANWQKVVDELRHKFGEA